MKHRKLVIISLLIALIVPSINAQLSKLQVKQTLAQPKPVEVPCLVEGNDTFPMFKLPPVYVYPPLHFKNKREERFYWRTVRDVKTVLPLARYIRKVVQETNDTLMKMPNNKMRDRYMRNFETQLYKREEARFKKLTYNQGKLLIRIIDRDFDVTSYDLIKAYRGGFRAGFYQLFAKMFGADLKAEFGSNKNDAIIERIIVLVENGQL